MLITGINWLAVNVLPAAHLLAFSTLTGTQLYQSFLVTKITYRSLPRPAFINLQKRLFPIYFNCQSALLLLTAATYPLGPWELVQSKGVVIPFAVAGVTAALNLVVYGPKTRTIMLEMQSGFSKPSNPSVPNPTNKQLLKSFKFVHSMSVHLNLITVAATLAYGWRLASHLSY